MTDHHPDFFRITEILIKHCVRLAELQEDGKEAFNAAVSALADPESLAAVAIDRANTVVKHHSHGQTVDLHGLLCAVWTEGFIVGADFQKSWR